MEVAEQSCLDGFPIRADVAGPGVRIAFYIQTLSTILFVWMSPKDVSSSHWSMVSTALGLSIAGIVTGVRKEISLVDALIIIDAVLLAFYACDFINSEFVSRMKDVALLHRRPSALWVICSTLCSLLSCVFGLYVWSTAPTFGASWYECNETLKVTFLGLSLAEGRKVQLVIWAVNAAFFAWRAWNNRRMLGDACLELFWNKVPRQRSNLELLARLSKDGPPFWFEIKLANTTIKPPRFIVRNFDFIWAVTFSIVTIISTEAMVRTYKREHNLDTEWNFGQALPVLLTLAPVFALVDVLATGDNHRDIKARSSPHYVKAHQFASTLFLALWCAPSLRKEMTETVKMTRKDLKVLESLVEEAYARWDSDGRTGDLMDTWHWGSDGELTSDDEAPKFESVYFDAQSHISLTYSSQGYQFAGILWDAVHRLPGLVKTLRHSNVVKNDAQWESLRVVVAQTWDLWNAHRDRTKRFRWWALARRPHFDVRTALASANRRLVGPVVPDCCNGASPQRRHTLRHTIDGRRKPSDTLSSSPLGRS